MVKKFRVKRGLANIPDVDPSIMESGNLRSEKSSLSNKVSDIGESLKQGAGYIKDVMTRESPSTSPDVISELRYIPEPISPPTSTPTQSSTVAPKVGEDGYQETLNDHGEAADINALAEARILRGGTATVPEKSKLDQARSLVARFGKRVNKEADAADNYLGKTIFNLDDKNTDKYAIYGGSSQTRDQLEIEKKGLEESKTKLDNDLLKSENEYDKLQTQFIAAGIDRDQKGVRLKNARDANKSVEEITQYTKDYNYAIKQYEDLRSKMNAADRSVADITIRKNLNEKSLKSNNEKFSSYNKSVILGKEKYNREHSWRKEWMQPISENATSMIGKPTINNASDIAGYGPLGATSVSNAFNRIIKPVQMAPGAGAWFKTTAGDRGLVEGLVKLNQNNMITPFGSPGTVAGGSMSRQFAYNIPLNRIGVGDVTAKPGYRINIEDIRRKKSLKSKPKITRQKISKIQSKNNVSVGGNLKMNIPTFPILHSEKNGGLNNTGLVNGTFKINTPKIKDSMNISVGKYKSTDLLNVNKTNIGLKINVAPVNKSSVGLKINILPISLNDNPQSNSMKINLNGITPFTFKNVENNLNTVTEGEKKRLLKKLKVKV